MTNQVLQDVATALRSAESAVSRIVPMTGEAATIAVVNARADLVVESLDALSAGDAPAPNSNEVSPTDEFLDMSESLLVLASQQLANVTSADVPSNKAADLAALKTRVVDLKQGVAAAVRR